MKCPNCGANVPVGDSTCKKCGYSMTQATTTSEGYRSRFGLVLMAWAGAFLGLHLNWLGYPEKAKELRQTLHVGLGMFIMPWYLVIDLFYHLIECIAVIFGKYREDAQGRPVRYFKPKNK